MRGAVRAALLILGLAVHGTGAVSADLENGVLKLQEGNFDTALEKFPNLMVKFYAPWCGHCKAMQPAYEKAAKKLKKMTPPPGRLAKVDATVERTLSKKYDVKGYPTLLVFKNGELFTTYTGGREKADIVDYMSTMDYPLPVGVALRSYYMLRSVYKELIKLSPLPQEMQRHFNLVFPLLLMVPVGLTVLCFGLVLGGSKPAPQAAAKDAPRGRGAEAARPKRSASPAVERAKKDDGDEKGESAEPKGEEEKKED